MFEALYESTYTRKSDRERGSRRKYSALSFIGAGLLSGAAEYYGTPFLKHDMLQHHAPINVNSLQYALAYHSGDYVNGYADAIYPAIILGLTAGNTSYKKRLALSAGLSVGSILLAEVPQLSGLRPDAINGWPIFGHADLADIPAGILGVLAFAGTTLAAGKVYQRGRR